VGFFLGILFGAVGTGYLVYAKRQYSALFAITGFALVIYPYFFTNTLAVVLIGAALCAAPFVIQRMG
jgi:hypothetical protein